MYQVLNLSNQMKQFIADEGFNFEGVFDWKDWFEIVLTKIRSTWLKLLEIKVNSARTTDELNFEIIAKVKKVKTKGRQQIFLDFGSKSNCFMTSAYDTQGKFFFIVLHLFTIFIYSH